MSKPTNPTLAELNAAVDKALTRLARELPRPTPMSMVARIGDAASALITAAEARGAARERERECRWVWDDDHGEWLAGCCRDSEVQTTDYCRHCGGRVVAGGGETTSKS